MGSGGKGLEKCVSNKTLRHSDRQEEKGRFECDRVGLLFHGN
jgi:hypothetical protein